ncbi:unnamed protein product [Larinioides sclopetarius]|uniref:Uncharacterized protein n=1 Tax=Larinioides sclopetarius TaxID=280406 RepID=A0AAV2ABI0_9ARAC
MTLKQRRSLTTYSLKTVIKEDIMERVGRSHTNHLLSSDKCEDRRYEKLLTIYFPFRPKFSVETFKFVPEGFEMLLQEINVSLRNDPCSESYEEGGYYLYSPPTNGVHLKLAKFSGTALSKELRKHCNRNYQTERQLLQAISNYCTCTSLHLAGLHPISEVQQTGVCLALSDDTIRRIASNESSMKINEETSIRTDAELKEAESFR